jgi:hypothetical protein
VIFGYSLADTTTKWVFKAVYSAAERLNEWNGTLISTIDVETLKAELQEALSKTPQK